MPKLNNLRNLIRLWTNKTSSSKQKKLITLPNKNKFIKKMNPNVLNQHFWSYRTTNFSSGPAWHLLNGRFPILKLPQSFYVSYYLLLDYYYSTYFYLFIIIVIRISIPTWYFYLNLLSRILVLIFVA
jgi:hypothetical protein